MSTSVSRLRRSERFLHLSRGCFASRGLGVRVPLAPPQVTAQRRNFARGTDALQEVCRLHSVHAPSRASRSCWTGAWRPQLEALADEVHPTSGRDLGGKALPSRLPADPQSHGDLVPRPAMCAGDLNRFAQLGLIGTHRLRGDGDLSEVIGTQHFCGRRVQFVVEQVEAYCRLLDLFFCVSHLWFHLLIRRTGRTSVVTASRG